MKTLNNKDNLNIQLKLISANNKINKFPDEKISQVENDLEKIFGPLQNKASLNKQVAEYNGITVSDLINSPNYDNLINDFSFNIFTKVSEILIQEYSLTVEESWAIILVAIGEI